MKEFTLLSVLLSYGLSFSQPANPANGGNMQRITNYGQQAFIDFGNKSLRQKGNSSIIIQGSQYFNDNFKNIDLVISDKSMPKMNGEELVKRMRSLHPTVPIIVLSGFVSNDDDNVLIQNGASKILLKPLSIRDIANEVNELLGL